MEHIPQVFWLIPIASVCALGMAWYFFKSMMKAEEGTPRMVEIAEYVRRGAMAYLKQQYKVVLIVFVVLAIVFAIMAYGFNAQNEWVPFAFLTGGFFSGLAGFFGMKTATYASARTANAARNGLNDGLKIAFRSGAVMGLVVVGLGLLDIAIWFIVLTWFYSDKMTTSEMLITITTTMLTFGMGASTQALFARVGGGIYTKAAVLIAAVSFLILYLLGLENWLGVSFSVIAGLAAGVIIGQATEYYTSQSYMPTKAISEASHTGAATVIIKGIGTGMISTCVPVLSISVAIMLSYLCANGFDMSMSALSIQHGLYGIGIAAVGMLSTLGITLATDAYGPIADNAGGNAEMSELGAEVRQRTDALDALGNTTAATGKGFAIGSAALTALALLASYIEEIKIAMARVGTQMTNVAGETIDATKATIPDFMNFFQVNLMNPKVLVGAFIGAMAAFLFCGLTMGAVGRAAGKMVEEVRRQFREIKGILEGTGTPDYGRCVEISTQSAQHEMIIPSLLAIIIPVVVGLLLGVAGVLGLLVGGLAAGFTLAVFMSNAGGAWDNAKKYVEEGNFGGKGSDAHKATIVGDTVGDPFKDTSGPSLNILIKLISMVSIVMAGLTVACL